MKTRENRLAVLLLQVGIATVFFVLAEHPSPTPGPATNRPREKAKPEVTQTVVLGRKYVLESSTDLINWTASATPFIAESETIVTEFDVDVTGRFFRLSEVP